LKNPSPHTEDQLEVTVLADQFLTPSTLKELNLVSNPAITPDGRRVLYTVAKPNLDLDTYESTIMVYDLDSRRAMPLQQGPSDTCPIPAPDSHTYIFTRRQEQKARKGIPQIELRVSTVETPGASRLLMRIHGLISASWSPDSKAVAVAIPVGKPDEDVKIVETLPVWFNGKGYVYKTMVKPFILYIDSAESVEIQVPGEWIQVVDVAWSPDGRRIALSVARDMFRPYLHDVIVYDVDTGKSEVIVEGLSGYGEVVWSPDSRYIAYLGHRRERGFSTHNRILLIDVENPGKEPECLTCSLDRNALNTVNSDVRFASCVKKIQWTRKGILFHVSDSGKVPLYHVKPGEEPRPYFDPGDAVVDEFTATPDASKVAVTVMSASEPKELYILSKGKPTKVTSHNSHLARKYRITSPRKFSFKASDGATIDGWVLEPPEGVERKGWVLYIHGGPKTMFGYGFMHEFHVLAASGYTVVYTNPRGSDGYSEEFADIRCHYGERDYQDLIEAAKYAIEQLGLPADKAAVMGGSYGGFMTNWIIGHTDMFKAAVTMRSISNWISMYGTTDIGWYFVEDQICCTPWQKPELCWEKSPLKYADKAKTPTLIIHSDEDYRCWLDQALQLYTALKLHGVKTRLAIFPGENHDLSRSGKPKHRVKRLELIVQWLNENIAGEHKEEKKEATKEER
jgi:dipeptidyl aminopeptidase/acylaminoacyl peptidase